MIRVMTWKLYVIEINKLISESSIDTYSIYQLFNSLRIKGRFNSPALTNEELKVYQDELKQHSKFISSLRDLRNYLYAHKNKDRKDEMKNSEFMFVDVDALNKSIEKIIKGIGAKLIDTEYILKSPGFESKKLDLLRILSNEWENKNLELVKQFNEHQKNKKK